LSNITPFPVRQGGRGVRKGSGMVLGVKDDATAYAAAGQETLRRMADVGHYNQWIYRLIRPYLGRRIVEVGCGIGNMTGYFLGAESVLAFDLLPESAAWVGRKFAGQPHVQVRQGDVCDAAFIRRVAPQRFDTVISINMLEHVGQDAKALRYMYELLGDTGHL